MMKKTIVIVFALVVITVFSVVVFASKESATDFDLPNDVKEWEKLAEQGDTAALHNVLRFYDDNSFVTLVVVEAVTADGEDITEEVQADLASQNDLQNQYYNERLNYWLDKGLALNDSVAIFIEGMRLYYDDEEASLPYLSKAAEMGNSRAALFCGSAYYNLHRGDMAIKYLTIADELGEPSAGWHLAMCYSGNAGVPQDLDKAIHYLERSGLRNCPEAVLELNRIDPENPLWQLKADSLNIDSSDF